MDERFPAALSDWTPVPNALQLYARDLGIGANEVCVVVALERHRRVIGDEVFPSHETLARETPLSVRQVRRAIAVLGQKGLLEWRQPGRVSSTGGRLPNHYRLDPLYERLAELHLLRASTQQVPDPSGGLVSADGHQVHDGLVRADGHQVPGGSVSTSAHRVPDPGRGLVSASAAGWCPPADTEEDVVKEEKHHHHHGYRSRAAAAGDAPDWDLVDEDELQALVDRHRLGVDDGDKYLVGGVA
jgi:hypothetical protein